MSNLAKHLQELFIAKGFSLSVAESCTGGALSSFLTQNPGASAYFFGGVVPYSNAMKIKLLSVSALTIEKYGAVSGPVVTEMLNGLLNLTNTDVGVAISGIAGPAGGSKEKPVGTVFCAIGKRGKTNVFVTEFSGARASIIEQATQNTVLKLIEFLSLN